MNGIVHSCYQLQDRKLVAAGTDGQRKHRLSHCEEPSHTARGLKGNGDTKDPSPPPPTHRSSRHEWRIETPAKDPGRRSPQLAPTREATASRWGHRWRTGGTHSVAESGHRCSLLAASVARPGSATTGRHRPGPKRSDRPSDSGTEVRGTEVRATIWPGDGTEPLKHSRHLSRSIGRAKKNTRLARAFAKNIARSRDQLCSPAVLSLELFSAGPMAQMADDNGGVSTLTSGPAKVADVSRPALAAAACRVTW